MTEPTNDTTDSTWEIQKPKRNHGGRRAEYKSKPAPQVQELLAKHKQTSETKPTETKPKQQVQTTGDQKTRVQHPLYDTFTFWFFRKEKGSEEDYEKSIKKIGDFNSVEGFWSFYSHLNRATDLPVQSDYHMFRRGIKPMWEDIANVNGGKWIVRCKKEYSPRLWEDLLLAVIGDQFDVQDDICGVVLSIRDYHNIIGVWNKTANNKEIRYKIRDDLKKILRLPTGTILEYKAHNKYTAANKIFYPTTLLLFPKPI